MDLEAAPGLRVTAPLWLHSEAEGPFFLKHFFLETLSFHPKMKGCPLQATVLTTSPAQPALNGWGALAGHTLCGHLYFSLLFWTFLYLSFLSSGDTVQKSVFRGLILGSGSLILDSQPLPFSSRAAPGFYAMRPLVAGGGIPVKFSGGSHYMLTPNKISWR